MEVGVSRPRGLGKDPIIRKGRLQVGPEQGTVCAFRNRRMRQERDVREKQHSFDIRWFPVEQPACQVQSRGSLAPHAECDRVHGSNPEKVRIFPFGCGEPFLPCGGIHEKERDGHVVVHHSCVWSEFERPT